VSLLALQRDFEQWLTREPAALPASFGEGHRTGLGVYLNNYRAQLLACLASSFPAVRVVMGDAAFDAAAARHIERRPPHSWTLDAYAEGFPRFLDDTSPWLGELARLELALATAFVGPDARPLDAARLAAVDWDRAILRLAPTFVLLSVTTNVENIHDAISAGRAAPLPECLPAPASIAVWRAGFASRSRAVSTDERDVLERVRDGARFEAICALLIERLGAERGTDAAGAMLSRWIAEGMIAEIVG
jgi:hypothetical protein